MTYITQSVTSSYQSGSYAPKAYVSASQVPSGSAAERRALNRDKIRNQRAIDAASPCNPAYWTKLVSPMDSKDVWIQMEWENWRNAQIKVSGSYLGDGFFENA